VTTFAQSSLILNWDKHKSSIASAENLLTIHNTFYKFTDSKIKTKYWEEDSWHKKLGGLAYRFSKSILLDNQADWLVHIHQHEVFGHGFRYREFDLKRNSYNLSLFPPYGSGGGFALRGRSDYPRFFGAHENIATSMGGMESASVLSERLRNKWLQSGQIHYRESLLFLSTLHDCTAYIYGTGLELDDSAGNDVNNFLRQVNFQYGFVNEEDYQLTINDLAQRASVNLVNTFQFFAIYTYIKTYLIDGEKNYEYPIFNVGKTDWLPSVRFGLTPFGSEFIIENFLKTEKSLTQIRLRIGDGKLDKAYGGGISYRRDWTPKLSINAIADLWIQPSMQLGGEELFDTKEGLGGRLIAEIDYQFNKKYPIGLFTQIGYKTTGFYPGEILNKGAIARIGISLKAMN
jgi:hypothetical protein